MTDGSKIYIWYTYFCIYKKILIQCNQINHLKFVMITLPLVIQYINTSTFTAISTVLNLLGCHLINQIKVIQNVLFVIISFGVGILLS